jgi:hypothetical protein
MHARHGVVICGYHPHSLATCLVRRAALAKVAMVQFGWCKRKILPSLTQQTEKEEMRCNVVGDRQVGREDMEGKSPNIRPSHMLPI